MNITQKKKTILEQLEERKQNREGALRKWIGSSDPTIKKKVEGDIWIQPLLASELDQARIEADFYLENQFKTKTLEGTIEELRSDAIASAALTYGIRDPETKERIFKSQNNVYELRSKLTNEEIFYLSQILDSVTFSFAESKHWAKDEIILLANQLAESGDTSILEAVHVNQLLNMVMTLAKEVESKNKEIDELKANNNKK